MQYILGVDIGTTHCKAVALGRDGLPFDELRAGYPTIQSEPGQSEQDPDKVLDAVFQVLHESALQLQNDQLDAVCISAAMHSVLAVDDMGTPITPAYMWADTRSNDYALQLRGQAGSLALYERTGTPIHPMSPLCKIMWIRERMPDIFKRAAKFISIKEYIFHRLTGKYYIDHSIASATGLFNIHDKCWDTQALELAGISTEQLSQPVPVNFSTTGAQVILTGLGLPGDLSFVIGASDGCLANLGSGAIFPGEAALTIGTSGAVRIVVDQPRIDAEQSLFTYILTDDLFVTGGAVSNGAAAMKWFSENFLQHNFTSADDIAWFLDLAKDAPPGAGGLLFLPYLSGERAPHWDASARAVFVGMQTAHGPMHMARAVAEGISFALWQVMQAVEMNYGSIETVYASGGFTNSDHWLQLIADITGKPITVLGSADASATGACLLGMHTLGWIKDWKAIKQLIRTEKKYLPDEANHEAYKHYYEIYRQLYPKLKDNFRELEKLQQRL